jgi:hypothetical protein
VLPDVFQRLHSLDRRPGQPELAVVTLRFLEGVEHAHDGPIHPVELERLVRRGLSFRRVIHRSHRR